jgi:hypothetical protein
MAALLGRGDQRKAKVKRQKVKVRMVTQHFHFSAFAFPLLPFTFYLLP